MKRNMTKLVVVSTYTAIPGHGQVDFGDCDLQTTTVEQVKRWIESLASVPFSNQSIWWRGYILDQDSLSLSQACVGVNEGEAIDVNADSLVLFLTTPSENYQREDEADFRTRSSSFDLQLIKQEMARRSRETVGERCRIL